VTQESAGEFRTFGVPGAPWGTATIRRGPEGVQVRLRVTDPVVQATLEGDAITIWMASFHDPSACAVPNACVPADLGNVLTGGFLQRVGGRVLGNGPINLAVNAREGDTSTRQAGTADGLVDAETDEIHVVIRSHGPPIPGMVDEQIHTVTGGCLINGCTDVAVAIFF